MAWTSERLQRNLERWFSNDDLFLAELAEGKKWERYLAEKLQDMGLPVFLPDSLVPPGATKDEAKAILAPYGDIVIGHDLDGVHLEVKSRRLRFTSPADFPYETAFFDNTGSAALRRYPTIHVLVSRLTGAAIWVDPQTAPVSKRRVVDRVRGIPVHIWEVHRRHLRPLGDLPKYLGF